jgi:hypothetical protein
MAKETTKIRKCTCKNEGQDKIYGLGNRLCNLTQKLEEFRCTVCNIIHKLGK